MKIIKPKGNSNEVGKLGISSTRNTGNVLQLLKASYALVLVNQSVLRVVRLIVVVSVQHSAQHNVNQVVGHCVVGDQEMF